jgi:hypothetical protein
MKVRQIQEALEHHRFDLALALARQTRDPLLLGRTEEAVARVEAGGPVLRSEVAVPPHPLREGHFLVAHPPYPSFTFRIARQSPRAAFAPGQRLLSRRGAPVLPANEEGERQVGLVSDDGHRVTIFPKQSPKVVAAVTLLRRDVDAAARAFALETGCCPRCGETLSDRRSLASLAGKRCAALWTWPYFTAEEAAAILEQRARAELGAKALG